MTIEETFHALFHAACADRDADAFAALWAAGDPAVTMWGSELDERAAGLDEIAELGRAITGSVHSLVFEWDEVHVSKRDEVAWVNASGVLDVDGSRSPYRVTAVLVDDGAGWRWHTFNGSEPN